MRNLKRALSLALAAAMLIGMMVVGASAAEYKDADSIENTEAVDVLTALGVIGGSDGNYNPQKNLTRAEFCVMIANALTGGKFDKTLFEDTATPFTDINGHWGAAYIAYCYSAGVIAGTGDGTTFSPDKTLTAAQAEAILLSALGYNKAGEFGLNGQFELNVMEPTIAFCIFHSMEYLTNALHTFVDKLLIGLQPNTEQCKKWVENSVGIVTALLPHIGYEQSAALAKEAYNHNRPIREVILEQGLLEEDKLNHILAENTGKPVETIAADCERDNFMSAEEAQAYGLVDKVIYKR